MTRPTGSRWAILFAALVGLTPATSGQAQWRADLEPEPTPATEGEPAATPPAVRRSAWQELTHPGVARARSFVRQGLRAWNSQLLRDPVTGVERPPMALERRAALVQNAIVRYRLARRYDPSDPHILYLLALTTAAHLMPAEGSAEPSRRDAEALALFEELREQAPEWNAPIVAFEIGVLRTRARQYEEAASEYRLVLGHGTSSPARASEVDPIAAMNTLFATGNLAEVTMLSGDVETAVTYYEQAVALARSMPGLPPNARSSTVYGLAVALDRVGEHASALERASQAISLGGGLSGLREDVRQHRVFFEPAYELYYYEGIGHLAEARDAVMAAERARARRAAVESFQHYLSAGGSESEFASLARRHIVRTGEELSSTARRRNRRRR